MAQVKWIPAAQRFSAFLQQQAEAAARLDTQIYETKKKINTEQFAANIYKGLAGAKSVTELNTLTGLAYSEALSKGFTGAIPMIGQYASLYGQKLGIEKQEALGRAYLETIPADQKFFVGEDLMTASEIKNKYASYFPDDTEGAIAQLISRLPTPQLQTRIGMDEGGNFTYTEGYTSPGGTFTSTATGREQIRRTPEGQVYLERGGAEGFQEGEDRYLTPGEMQGYTDLTLRKKQQEMQMYYYSMMDKDNLGLQDLMKFRTIAYQERGELFGAAYLDELSKIDKELEPQERDAKEREINMRYYGTPEQGNKFLASDYESLRLLNPTFYAANEEMIKQMKQQEEFTDELWKASNEGENVKNYIRERSDYLKKLDPAEETLFNEMSSTEEKYNLIKSKEKPTKNLFERYIPDLINPEFQSPFK